MIVWCTIFVILNQDGSDWKTETAAKGKVKQDNGVSYVVDFSEYAREKNYEGYDYNNYNVNKDNCVKDE